MSKRGLIYLGIVLLEWVLCSFLIKDTMHVSFSEALTNENHMYLLLLVYWWIPFIVIK
jgi:hypothetical protein